MIFDFRLRPPYGEFSRLGIFQPEPCNAQPPLKYHARRTESAFATSMDLFFEEMRAAGIERGVIMPRATASAQETVSNVCVQALATAYPEIFVPFGGIDVSRGIAHALEELDTCVRMGFRGIAMEPGYFSPPRKADDAVLYPVYAHCEKLGLPVVLTLSLYQGPTIGYCQPASVQQVALDFPGLQIVVAHACYPWIPQIFSVAAVCRNVWLLPDLYLLNPMTPGNEMYENCLRWLDCERVLFGSAYPCYDMRQAVEDMERFNLTPAQREKLMYGNAAALLRL